jgi:hypothetical protein
MPAREEILAHGFVTIELAIHDASQPAVVALQGLIARHEINDAQTGMAQADAAPSENLGFPTIRAPVLENGEAFFQDFRANSFTTRIYNDKSAHAGILAHEPYAPVSGTLQGCHLGEPPLQT